MKTIDSLIEKYGCKIIPLEDAFQYAGIKSLKTAKERAINYDLPFPAFRVGKKANWFVNVERVAEYLDNQDKSYAEKFAYKNNSTSMVG